MLVTIICKVNQRIIQISRYIAINKVFWDYFNTWFIIPLLEIFPFISLFKFILEPSKLIKFIFAKSLRLIIYVKFSRIKIILLKGFRLRLNFMRFNTIVVINCFQNFSDGSHFVIYISNASFRSFLN